MALWFYRGLRRGVATTGYPKVIDSWADQLPSPPAFHSARLTSELADRLVRGCAANALRREGHELVVDAGRCTGCGRCVELGDGVVAPSGEFQLATGDRAALIKRVSISGEGELRDARR